MRRGLISWSRAELPEAVLDARIAAAQAAMAGSRLDALAVYTIPARTAGVSHFTGFVPYWNEGLLAIPREGRPVLVSALSNRVKGWIQRNAHVESVLSNPRIGAEVARFVEEKSGKGRIGVADLARLPVTVTEPLAASGHTLVDASELMAGLRAVADPAEIALTARAAHIAHTALAAIPDSAREASAVVAAIEGTARSLGAEEIYVAVAVDLAGSTSLVQISGTRALGEVWAVRASLAYKGNWVRLTRTIARDPGHAAAIDAATVRFAAAVAQLPDTTRLAAFRSWLVEGCRTTTPLEPLAGSVVADPQTISPGALVDVQAIGDEGGMPVLLAAPVLIGVQGQPASLLVPPAF